MEMFPVKIVDGDGVMVAEAAGEFDGLAILTFLPAGEYRVGDARARVSRVFDWDGDLVQVDCGLDFRPWHCITARHPESSLIDPRIRGRLVRAGDRRPHAGRPSHSPVRRRRRPCGVMAAGFSPSGEAGLTS